MFRLDEAAEGKFVQNTTMLKLDVVYERHLICSVVLGATRKVKVHMNACMFFQVPSFPSQYCTYSEFSLKSKLELGSSFAEENVWKLDLKAK